MPVSPKAGRGSVISGGVKWRHLSEVQGAGWPLKGHGTNHSE